ncbi:YCII-related domain protein [Blumeria hordei DH14]|uniref:YCII-related domain protein n=1 Tax=Blumeria graminis f. sp. hordei (strain DH14) TaxID=546991 RepID=N1JIT2_BLUG1|nr:YCII-related domain protein [Blumeria hordei DH14]
MPVFTHSLRHLLLFQRLGRNMTTKSNAMEWLVILPDLPGKQEARMAVRPQHIEDLKKDHEKGFWKMGGAYLEDVPKGSEDLKIQGSAVIAYAESRDEVIEKLKKDVYAEAGVWDFSKVQIYPFKCAVRTAV